jgi:CheY-like chemotaxis protein
MAATPRSKREPVSVSTSNQVRAKTGSRRSTDRARKTIEDQPTAKARRILVVDDVLDVTEMIALFLKHAGFDVKTANSANSALTLAAQNQFDLIISDIGMPEKNGYELAESLRNRSNYQSVPMIAVTGYTEYDDRGRSLRAGFNAHLTKPINPAQLLNVIGELLEQS